MVFEPRNKFLYISDYSNGVWGYSFNSTTGALTKITGSPFAAGSCTWGLTVDPSAAFLYAANYCSSNITGYTIDQNTGALTPMGSSFAPSNMNDNNSIAITH
jgi:6-phosphogluconolactonase (cycloisomerase 2 family)